MAKHDGTSWDGEQVLGNGSMDVANESRPEPIRKSIPGRQTRVKQVTSSEWDEDPVGLHW